MTREAAAKLTRDELDKHGLKDWHIRLIADLNHNYLGMCSYKDKCIILNAHHIDIHPDPEIVNTIRHEIAHALTPGHAHDSVWETAAKQAGCTSIGPCSSLSFTPEIIDAIRSGADVEVSFETQVIHKPKYQVTRIQDKCPHCGKVAKTKREQLIPILDESKPDQKWIFLECGHLLIKNIPKGTPFYKLLSEDGKKPYKFQLDGMQFIEAALAVNSGAAIFDEMGLGKTIQAVGYCKFHPEDGPFLFIVKSAIKFQWFKELIRWGGIKFAAQIISSSKDYLIPGMKCYIISYDMLVFKTRKSKATGKDITQGFDIEKFNTLGVKTVILDECQQIKNPDASRSQQVRRICKGKKVIALSGTPWKNRGSEFFTVLNILAPMKFPSHDGFLNTWVDYYYDGKFKKQAGIRNVPRFREYVKDIVLRREIAEVEVEMPDVTRSAQYAVMGNKEQSTYDDETARFVKWYDDKILGGEEDSFAFGGNILAKLARMRHLTGLAKIEPTVDYVTDFLEETDRKITIFVHHVDVGEILLHRFEDKMRAGEMKQVPIFKITSSMSPQDRFETQESFNKTPQCILVASTLAAGEGLNLQTCGDAILHERQWNPQNEDQAAPGRFRRIEAAHKRVNVIFMTAMGTVDEILGNIVEKKRAHFHNTMNKGEMPKWDQNALAKEVAAGIVAQWKAKQKTQQAVNA